MKRRHLLWLLPPLAVGVGLAAWLIAGSEPPARTPQELRSVTANIQTVEPQAIRPVVRGYGTVRAAQRWQAVAEVAGAITYRHPDLETGKIIPAGTRVLDIDPTRYDFALAQAEADLAALRAEREQLEVEAENTRRLLTIEQDRLNLAKSDLERVRALVARGTAPQSRQDDQERTTLQIRRVVQELQNSLDLVPVRQTRLTAQIARAAVGLETARRDLEMTTIETPFSVRIGEVHAERHQFVPAGGRLVTADGTARAEVTAQLPIEGFPRLVGAVGGAVDLETADQAQFLDRINTELRLVSDPGQTWQGRVIRIENALDPQARSVPVVIEVEAPYAGAHPPLRLPLVPNMYVEAVLTGPAGEPRIALPASAVHEGDTVYLRDNDGRLAFRQIEVAWRQDGLAMVSAGLSAGDQVILDDIVPALPGLRVIPAGDAQ